jgi:3-oxoacyl-[acyl-carrier protein] reductase
VKKYEGRVAIVTGAGRGIGRAIAMALAAEGAAVVVNYLHSATAAEQVVADIVAQDGIALAVQADVSRPEDANRLVETTLEKFKRLDIVVNNAGISRDRLLAQMSFEDCWDVMTTNFGSVFNMTRAAMSQMMTERQGRIINISSTVVERAPVEGQSNYTASKAAIEAFMRCAALELSRFGVTVNAVSPGFVHTELVDGVVEKHGQRLLKRIPLRSFGTPAEVAAAVVFLASDEARYITGEVIHVDGGMNMSVGI